MKYPLLVLAFIICTCTLTPIAIGAQSNYELGEKERVANNNKQAIEYYTLSINAGLLLYDSYNERGICKYILEDFEGSSKDFLSALKFTNNDVEKQLHCIKYITNPPLKKLSLAISILDSLIKINPLVHYYDDRARYKHDKDDYTGAIEDYLYVLLHLTKPDHEIYWHLADCYFEKRKFSDAIKNINKVIELSPQDYADHMGDMHIERAYLFRGKCELELENYKNALADFILALSTEDEATKPDVYNYIGETKIYLEDYQGAIVELTKCIDIHGGNTISVQHSHLDDGNIYLKHAHILRGIAYHALSNDVEACKDWRRALELGENSVRENIKNFCK